MLARQERQHLSHPAKCRLEQVDFAGRTLKCPLGFVSDQMCNLYAMMKTRAEAAAAVTQPP